MTLYDQLCDQLWRASEFINPEAFKPCSCPSEVWESMDLTFGDPEDPAHQYTKHRCRRCGHEWYTKP